MVWRLIRHAAFSLVLIAAVWMGVSLPLPQGVFAQEGVNRAALVVRFADGSVLTECVSFSEPSISGAELLARSGLRMILDTNSGLGGAVCSIRDQGCAFPAEDCFCRCQGQQCEYWAYYHRLDGRWHYSQMGAGSYRVTDGAVEGWSWGPGDFASGTEPPDIAFAEACGAPAARTTGLLAPEPQALRSPARPLLAQYGPFLFMAVLLLGAGAWVGVRRRSKETLVPERSPRS